MTLDKKTEKRKRISLKNRYKIEAEMSFGKMKITFCDCVGIGEYTSEAVEIVTGLTSVLIRGRDLKLSVLDGGIAVVTGKVSNMNF